MSGPYVYTPSSSTPSTPFPNVGYNPSPFYAQFYPQNVSPHIPAVSMPGTPVQGTSPLLPIGSFPNAPIQSTNGNIWNPQYSRPRRPSFHAPSPYSGTQSLAVPTGYTHTRRRSFNGQYRNTSPWAASPSQMYGLSTPLAPRSEINPALQSDSRDLIQLDLSNFSFLPTDRDGRELSKFDLAAPATNPPTDRLVITSEVVPGWPIVIDYRGQNGPYSTEPLPISVGEVLEAIHMAMQTQITHSEWATLTEHDGEKVTEAYKRRYKLVPGYEYQVSRSGVRRIDFLHKRVMFAGLERRFGDEGFEDLKLVVKSRPHWSQFGRQGRV